jgi:hypothetical protein
MTDLTQNLVPPGVKFDQTSRVMGRIEMEEIVKYTRLLQKTLETYQAAIIELQGKVTELES